MFPSTTFLDLDLKTSATNGAIAQSQCGAGDTGARRVPRTESGGTGPRRAREEGLACASLAQESGWLAGQHVPLGGLRLRFLSERSIGSLCRGGAGCVRLAIMSFLGPKLQSIECLDRGLGKGPWAVSAHLDHSALCQIEGLKLNGWGPSLSTVFFDFTRQGCVSPHSSSTPSQW